ncbi:MAG: winged helix-turn-helix domain-containing protein [Candidatus Helarchaeota archaeon]|nr:helix-turn-helix transcriptional regulator [Deltaproteobacteria bacterium]
MSAIELTKKRRGRPKIISDEVLLQLIGGARAITQFELRQKTGLKQNTLSIRIKKLKDLGLITTRKVRRGKVTFSLVSLTSPQPDKIRGEEKKSFIKKNLGFEYTDIIDNNKKQEISESERGLYIFNAVTLKRFIQKCYGNEETVVKLIPQITNELCFILNRIFMDRDKCIGQEEINLRIASVIKEHLYSQGLIERHILSLISGLKPIKHTQIK